MKFKSQPINESTTTTMLALPDAIFLLGNGKPEAAVIVFANAAIT
jgi:hypothetical protein